MCAVCGAPPASAAASPPSVPAGFVGMNVDSPLFPDEGVNLPAQLGTMVSSGVQTVRVVFSWAYAQPYPNWSSVPSADRSQFTNVGGVPTRFGQFDQLVAAAAKVGLRVFPTVMYSPPWDARPAPSYDLQVPQTDGPYAKFCAALVRRYGPHGTFWKTNKPAVPIHMWEIWNEPDLSYYWPEQPFPNSYAALLHAADDAIKAADRSAQVMVGALTDTSWDGLKALYGVRGVGKWFDGVALHPYTKYPAGVITILQFVRKVLKAHGGAGKSLVADEVSWPSSAGKGSDPSHLDIGTTEAGQAKNVATLLPLLAKNRRALNLVGFDWFTWAGADDPGGNLFDFSGLYHYAGSGQFTAKPATSAFRKAALAIEHCRRVSAIASVCAHH
jgi:polysaccharide biosynthesis protein PslG